MAKRKLTRRQAWRIRKIQAERRERAERGAVRVERQGASGPEQPGLVVANYGPTLDVEAANGQVYRCFSRQNIDTPVPGDRVVWQKSGSEDGVVVALSPRRSLLARREASGRLKALAANIDQALVVIAPRPAFSTYLIDQYLVAAETAGIHPMLVFNKAELLDADSRRQIAEELKPYEAIGYRLLYASTRTRDGLNALRDALATQTSVFVGQSGVGKSSLVQAILPEENIRVGDLINERHGSHTTSASRLYHLPAGGQIIDSPGVREFGLSALPFRDIAQGFIEFRPYLDRCRFRDCRHGGEPGCFIREAVEKGDVDPRRLASYHRLLRDFGCD